jgi:hypothetical protein
MSPNSGVPAVLVPHDSRTREMGDFAGIPTCKESRVQLDEASLTETFRKADFEKFVRRGARNKERYHAFLIENALTPNLGDTE